MFVRLSSKAAAAGGHGPTHRKNQGLGQTDWFPKLPTYLTLPTYLPGNDLPAPASAGRPLHLRVEGAVCMRHRSGTFFHR